MKDIFINTSDKIKLNVKINGSGKKIIFVHEFGGDQRGWEPQILNFSQI